MTNTLNTLNCKAVDYDKLHCKYNDKEYEVEMDKLLFDVTTFNNLKELSVRGRARFRLYGEEINVVPDEDSYLICGYYRDSEEVRCRVIGKRTMKRAPIWERLLDLPQVREPTDEKAELVEEILDKVYDEFPDLEEKTDYIKLYTSPDLGKQLYAATIFSRTDDTWIPFAVMISEHGLAESLKDEESKKKLFLDLTHEFVHVKRAIENEMKKEVGTDEGETETEAIIREGMQVRLTIDEPHYNYEFAMLAPKCILPYCFDSLEEVRDFQMFVYEFTTGYEKPRPANPENTPHWDEIKKRIPIAPLVDVMRAVSGDYNPIADTKEYWIVATSPSGRKFLYHLSDWWIDDDTMTYDEVIEIVDKLDALREDEDIEEIWDFP